MDAVAIAQQELEQYMEKVAEAIAPTCSSCSHFCQSVNFKNFGKCMADGTIVYTGDRACSEYGQPLDF